MLLLMKAQIAGGALGDLFAERVPVKGYARGGAWIGPHQALRHKLHDSGQMSLLGRLTAPPSPASSPEGSRNLGSEVARERAAETPAKKAGDAAHAARENIAEDLKRRGTQAKKMRESADKLATAAEEDFGSDRQVNTARRARMAAGAVADASRRLQIAETMRNLASAVENGEAKVLGAINSRAAVEELESLLGQAKYRRFRETGNSTDRWEDVRRRPISADDIRFARVPEPSMHPSNLRNLYEAIQELGIKGHKAIRDYLAMVAGGRDDSPVRLSPERMEQMRALAKDVAPIIAKYRNAYGVPYQKRNAADSASWSLKTFRDISAQHGRLERLGIRTDADLQRALAEFVIYRGGVRSEDPLKRMERELVGQQGVGIDFFPTPKTLVDQLVEQADIGPGMTVLEPSAGKGDIADAARVAGAQVDTVEISPKLQQILEAKGHHIVGSDFMQFRPEHQYDRIVMNPPFGDRMDAAHVRRAYDMLKPGGRLVAITGEGIHFGKDRAAAEFRDWLEEHGGVAEKLPEGSFKSAFRPTGVATRLVVVDKPEEVPIQPKAAPRPRNFGWDAVKLANAYSADELSKMIVNIMEDPENENPDYRAGKSLYIYSKSARKKLDALGLAIYHHKKSKKNAPLGNPDGSFLGEPR